MVRKITDLYKIGKEVVFEIENDEPYVVWIQKLQPFEQEIAITRAQGERAKIWALKKVDDDHPERSAHIMQVEEEFTHEDQVNLVSSDELGKARQSAEAFVAMEGDEDNEWAKDSYLDGLLEAWRNGAEVAMFNDDNPTAKADAERVFEELKRYNAEVEKEYDHRRKSVLDQYEAMSVSSLLAKAVDKVIEIRADMAWMQEYEKSEVWLATRDPKDHLLPIFENRNAVDQTSPIIVRELISQYKSLIVAPEEVKS